MKWKIHGISWMSSDEIAAISGIPDDGKVGLAGSLLQNLAIGRKRGLFRVGDLDELFDLSSLLSSRYKFSKFYYCKNAQGKRSGLVEEGFSNLRSLDGVDEVLGNTIALRSWVSGWDDSK